MYMCVCIFGKHRIDVYMYYKYMIPIQVYILSYVYTRIIHSDRSAKEDHSAYASSNVLGESDPALLPS